MVPEPPETPTQILNNLAWVLLALLLAEPDAPAIPIPRRWLAQWRHDVLRAVELLRQRP